MKKILSLVLGIILILSVVSFADDSSSGKSGDDRTLDDRERLDKRNNEFSEFREELNARKEAKRDVKEAKNELERVKVAYKNVKENYQSKKMELLQSRNKYRDCLNSEEEQCRLMVKKTNMITKEHLINSLDLIIKNLEQMKSNMQLSADLTHEEISEITNVIDEQIKKMQDARLKLETIDENTSRDEIREAASNIRQLWQEVKVHHNKIKLRHLGARLRTLIVKAEIVGERAREKASAMNLEKLNSLIENYEDELEKAKEQYSLGKEAWEKMLVPTQADESTRESQRYLKEANNHLKNAREKLRGIIQEFRNNKVKFSLDTEGVEQQ